MVATTGANWRASQRMQPRWLTHPSSNSSRRRCDTIWKVSVRCFDGLGPPFVLTLFFFSSFLLFSVALRLLLWWCAMRQWGLTLVGDFCGFSSRSLFLPSPSTFSPPPPQTPLALFVARVTVTKTRVAIYLKKEGQIVKVFFFLSLLLVCLTPPDQFWPLSCVRVCTLTCLSCSGLCDPSLPPPLVFSLTFFRVIIVMCIAIPHPSSERKK